MTKYIKGKNGKFAGSIGDGKDNVPSTGKTFDRNLLIFALQDQHGKEMSLDDVYAAYQAAQEGAPYQRQQELQHTSAAESVQSMKDKYRELTLANIGREEFSQEEIDTVKAMYERVLAMVPEDKKEFVNPRMTGTIESKKEYLDNHWISKDHSASKREYTTYMEVGSSIAHMLDGTLGLRD